MRARAAIVLAHRRVEVKTAKRVQLDGARHEQLDHDEARRFDDDGDQLQHKAGAVEVELADSGDHHAHADKPNKEKERRGWLLDFGGKGEQQHHHGRARLDHLDERDGQVHVGAVACDERHAKSERDGHDLLEVKFPRDLRDRYQRRRPRSSLREDRREQHVPARQGDRKGKLRARKHPFVEQNRGR